MVLIMIMFTTRRFTNYFEVFPVVGFKLLVLAAVLQSVIAQRGSLSGDSDRGPSNLKDAVLVYPTGIRSERDLPVCPSLAVDEEGGNKDVGPSFSPGASPSSGFGGNDLSKLQQPSSTRNPSESSRKSDGPPKSLAACNIIHKRYFYPPMIERLCRCPDRTECPMEWSQPPLYKDLIRSNTESKDGKNTVSTTPSTKYANMMDPFTVMISSRSQLKFCTEVSANLPVCEKQPKKDSSSDDSPSMVKTIKKTFIAPELPSVTLHCYCPPLFHSWAFISKNEPMEHSNGTVEASYFYRCEKLRRCKTGQQCGAIRTDFHFSYYHCICPKNNFCVPKVYPPTSEEDVISEAEEALYSGRISPAFCTPTQ